MADWAYIRLDPKYFGTPINPNTLAQAQTAYTNYFVNTLHINANNIKIETMIYHERPMLTNLLKEHLLSGDAHKPDPSPLPRNPLMGRNDVLWVYNLSHLSAEPAVLARLVLTIHNNSSQWRFRTVNSFIDTRDAGSGPHHVAVFQEWARLPTLRAPGRNGGGDGGGNGGC
jgi:hypothetical protein